MSIKDLIKVCENINTNTIFYVKANDTLEFIGRVNYLPKFIVETEIISFVGVLFNPRALVFDRIHVRLKES